MTRSLLSPAATLALACSLAPGRAHAELVPSPKAPRAGALASLSFEPELTLGTTLLLPLELDQPRAALALAAGLKWAALVPARGDLRLSLGAAGSYHLQRNWAASCAAFALGARAENEAATLYGLGIELRCQPAYLHAAWSFGLDLGVQSALSTHVEHSATARHTFEERYPPGVSGISGPRDGWYRFTATRFRIGLASSHRWDEHWTGALALGSLFALQEQGVLFAFTLAQLPLYLELAAGYAW